MSTISNEDLEEILQVSLDFLEEEENTNGKGDIQIWLDNVWPKLTADMARELLALRKERERAEPVAPDDKYQHLSELYHGQEKRLFKIAQRIKGPSFDKYAYGRRRLEGNWCSSGRGE